MESGKYPRRGDRGLSLGEVMTKKLAPIHPGEILLEEFLQPAGITQTAFANKLGWTRTRLNELIRGKRGVTAETAWLFSKAFNTTPQFWLNLQANYDLARKRPESFNFSPLIA